MWDSKDLVSAANLLNGTPDANSGANWAKGWYLERFPYQIPIVLLITICMKIAGSNFVVFFEILNCFACALTMYFTVKLSHELFHKRNVTILAGIIVMFFAPIILYCTFIYGNIICLPFALAGILFQKRAMDGEDTRKIVFNAIISVVLLALSVFIKSSMSIILVASLVVWFIWCIEKKRFGFLIFALAPFLILKLFTFATNSIVSAHVDINLNNGAPKIAWATMGIGGGEEYIADKENRPDIRNELDNPGYYDGFVWVTSADEYNPDLVSEISKNYLGKRLAHFVADPGFAIAFLTKKLMIEWTEPTFEGFLASNWHATALDTGYNMSERDYTALARSFYYGKMYKVIYFIMDSVQSIIAVGALTALVALRKKLKSSQLLPILFVLGGAVLYIVWENKSQYMFPFYLVMIPFASIGLIHLSTKTIPSIYERIKKRFDK